MMMRIIALWVIVGALVTPAWAGRELPEVKSGSAVALDARTGVEIFGKDADEIRPIASVTKIFVALAVRAKRLDLDGWTAITRSDAHEARGGSRTRLDIGLKFRNKDLLRAMLMASDNRAPTALGRAAGMSRRELIAAMNAVAKRLHLQHTRITDPTGLRGNTSTARELALALRAALADPVLRGIMGDSAQTVVAKGGRYKIDYGTTNHALLAGKHDVIGGKTGFTSAAGYCFITGARFDGREVLMAFLHADGKETRFADFDRVATWIEHGAPGAKTVTKRHAHHDAARLDTADRAHADD
jgi:serine-type D-Ala-D-Ala endopeptidase (penicillin-binding protein 7)